MGCAQPSAVPVSTYGVWGLIHPGDFIVMRRAPGATGGNVFRATSMISNELVDVLAGGVARLHALPPLLQVGDLTNSIRTDWWGLTIRESIERYIRNWFDLYLAGTHNPSPALVNLFGWLLDRIPDPPGRPVLLHGDIGFHNMLVDNGRLSVLVDWEFAHVGDPAEDVGYVRNCTGSSMDAAARPVRKPPSSCLSAWVAPCMRRFTSLMSKPGVGITLSPP